MGYVTYVCIAFEAIVSCLQLDYSPPPETARAPAKTTTDRFKTEGSLLEQGSRRSGVDRHGSRNGSMFAPASCSLH